MSLADNFYKLCEDFRKMGHLLKEKSDQNGKMVHLLILSKIWVVVDRFSCRVPCYPCRTAEKLY